MNKKIRELQARKAASVGAMRAINDKAAAEGREPTAEEITAFDGHRASIAGADAAIDREQALILAEASAGIVVRDDAHITSSDRRSEDPTRGFKSMGDFYKSVAKAGMGGGLDERLSFNAAAPTTFSNEAAGQDSSYEAMFTAGKAIALVGLDCLENQEVIESARAEWRERVASRQN